MKVYGYDEFTGKFLEFEAQPEEVMDDFIKLYIKVEEFVHYTMVGKSVWETDAFWDGHLGIWLAKTSGALMNKLKLMQTART